MPRLAKSRFLIVSSQYESESAEELNMKIRILQVVIFLFASVIEVNIASAKERFELFTGVRQMGMGGSSIGVVNDETSLLANPNGLGKLRDHIFTVIDPEMSLGDDFASYVADGGNPLDYFELQGVIDALQDTQDQHLHSKIQIFPSAVFENFGIGLFKKYNYDGHSSADGNSIDFDYYDDTTLVLGYNFTFLKGRMKLGISGKYLNRGYASETLAMTSVDQDVKDYIKEGVGIGADIGLTLSVPWKWLPSLTAVLRDAGNTKCNISSGMFYDATEEPDSIPQTLDVAFSFFPIHGNQVRSSFTFEYRDVENAYEEEDTRRRMHAGWELNLYDSIFIRTGMNQRYWTAGLELATQNMQFQLATYGEDVGVDETPKEDRRFVFKFSLRF
jgi:hypothetical protein